MRRDSLIIALSLVTLGLSGGVAHAKVTDGLQRKQARLARIHRDRRVSPAAAKLVESAAAQILRPSHASISWGKRMPLVDLKTTIRNGQLNVNAAYEIGPHGDLQRQALTISLKTGKGKITSEVYEGPGKADTVATQKIGE